MNHRLHGTLDPRGPSGDSPSWFNGGKPTGKWWFNGGLMGFNQQNGDFNGMYPLVMTNVAIENGP